MSRRKHHTQPINTIDLTTARCGDKFLLRDSSIVTFTGRVSPSNDEAARSFQLEYNGPGNPPIMRTRYGKATHGTTSMNDVVAKVRTPSAVSKKEERTDKIPMASLPIGTLLQRRDGTLVRLNFKGGIGDYPFKAGAETYTDDGTYMKARTTHTKDITAVVEIPRFKGDVFPPVCAQEALLRNSDKGTRAAKIQKLFLS